LHASTSKEQEEIFKQHGTRWSELWRLPYWNPTWQLVVDAMHCILEGHTQHHFQVVLCLTSLSATTPLPPQKAFLRKFKKIEPNDDPFPDAMTLKEVNQVTAIHVLLATCFEGVGDDGKVIDQDSFQNSLDLLSKQLLSKNMKPLQFVCSDLKCQPEPKTHPHSLVRHIPLYKKDWVEALVQWVSFSFSTSFND